MLCTTAGELWCISRIECKVHAQRECGCLWYLIFVGSLLACREQTQRTSTKPLSHPRHLHTITGSRVVGGWSATDRVHIYLRIAQDRIFSISCFEVRFLFPHSLLPMPCVAAEPPRNPSLTPTSEVQLRHCSTLPPAMDTRVRWVPSLEVSRTFFFF